MYHNPVIYLWATLLILLNVVWLFLNLLALPGNLLIAVTTTLLAWWQWDCDKGGGEQMFSIYTLIVIFVLAILGEVLEFLAGAFGAKKAGSSQAGKIGAILGAVAGCVIATFAIPIPVLGSLIGACGGAFGGAVLLELAFGGKVKPSLIGGAGAGAGRLAGTLAKLALGVIIWIIVAVAAYWP